MRYTASNLVRAIARLPRNQWFEYVHSATKTKVRIVTITEPEGPILIERMKYSKGSSSTDTDTISVKMIWRIANAIQEGMPFNVDRVLGASYNTRSALEALMAHASEFYWCKPGRIELTNSSSEIKKGHKHIVWLPSSPHENGVLSEHESDKVISEIPTTSAVYESLGLSEQQKGGMDIEVARRHLQIQIALVLIGRQIGYRTWIAHNDKGFKYGDRTVGEIEGVLSTLEDGTVIGSFEDAKKAAHLIDCIWFQNGKLMPAVMEVEHSTGITSGLTRMKGLQDAMPPFPTRWVIVAPDEDRDKVLREANRDQFKSLNAMFLPYSSVDELFSLCQRKRINRAAVNEPFLDCFMERCIEQTDTLGIN